MHTKRQFDLLSLRPAKVFSFAAVNDPQKTNRQLAEIELSKHMQVSTSTRVLLPWNSIKENNNRQIILHGKEYKAPIKVHSKYN